MSKQIKPESEQAFEWWANMLMDAGYIEDYKHHPKVFELTPKQTFEYTELKSKKNGISTKQGTGFLLHDWTYKPDYWIIWTQKAYGVLHYPLNHGHNLRETIFVSTDRIIAGKFVSIIEAKPDHKFKKEDKAFAHKQKAMFAIHNLYVNMFNVPRSLETTFVPPPFLLTEIRGEMKKRYKLKPPRNINQFIEMRTEWYNKKHG